MTEQYFAIKENKEDYFINRIGQILQIKVGATFDKFKKSFDSEDNKAAMSNFLKEPDQNKEVPSEFVFILQQGEGVSLYVETPHPDKFKRKGLIGIRISNDELTPKNLTRDLVFFEMTRQVLEHLYNIYHEVFAGVIQNPSNQQGWTDLITKDLMEKYNNYVAQVYVIMGLVKGKTMLPLPSQKLTSAETTPDKDKAHVFESSIITWTKQIRNVLKLDAEQVLKTEKDPGPLKEIEFWKHKAENLNAIYEQLQSVQVKNILRFLEGNKSTYTNPFSKIQKDVQVSRLEANDNYKFLKALEKGFVELTEGSIDFTDIHNLFIPIMHTILLIWKKSKYYNTPPRLVVLIREICNQIITKAREYVSGEQIKQLIQSEETSEACHKLQNTIDVCTKFKDAYFEYKAKAEGQWKLTTNALFVRLDSFLERCHDILHLTNTLMQFNKLDKKELGGTKGRHLTDTIEQIFKEFKEAVNQFNDVKYDIMDIDEKSFDDDFYKFRSKIKELERRLASVITQGFDDNDTIQGKFRILESFEGLLTRPIIQDELEKKHIVLLETYKHDLKTVQSIFLEGKKLVDDFSEYAPIFNNMPQVTGALTWCRGLVERIKEPLEKLSQLGQVIIEREEFKDVQKLYLSINRQIGEYEKQKILAWEKDVQANAQDKLKQFLLRKDENGLLKVNFDPALVKLLKEVKYFQLLGIQVPETAGAIYEKNEIYRKQTVHLDLIVQNYNHIITCLHPVEEPLIKQRIIQMDESLKPGLDNLQWQSDKIEDFINKAKEIVEETFQIVSKMKESIDKIKQCLKNINRSILEERKKKQPLAPDDYQAQFAAQFQAQQQNIKENSSAINKTLKEVLDAVKIDKTTHSWRAYQYYVNEIVLQGVIDAIMTSLTYLNDQINPESIKKNDIAPLFEIKLELGDKIIEYEPPVQETELNVSVRNIIKNWMCDFYQLSSFVVRLDRTEPGDFLQEVKDSFELKAIVCDIYQNLEWIEQEADNYKHEFKTYEEFWLKDAGQTFQEFLKENENTGIKYQDTTQQTQNIEGEEKADNVLKDNPLLKGCIENLPHMDLFDEKITELKKKQNEIILLKEKNPVDKGWLRINSAPLQRDLSKKVGQWYTVYTEFMKNEVKITLKNLKEFIKYTSDGIKKNPADPENIHDRQLLMSVMKVISDVKDVEPSAKGIIQRIKDIVFKLKKHNVPLMQEKGEEDPIQTIDNVYSTFKETCTRVIEIKNQIIQLQQQETKRLQQQLADFKQKVDDFREEFMKKLPFGYNTYDNIININEAYDVVGAYKKKLEQMEAEAVQFNKLEKLFDIEQTRYKKLQYCNSDLKYLKVMWDAVALVQYQYQDWEGKSWRSIKADELLEKNKTLQSQLKTLPKEVRNLKGYPNIVEKVKNMGTVLPLVSSLHSEFMEARHWKQLQTFTKSGEFDQTNPAFSFSDILKLELHKYENEVTELEEQAMKESKIEKKLKIISTAWQGQNFEFEAAGEGSDLEGVKTFIPLDNVIELLDQHSLDLMAMKSQGKYVEYFLTRVDEWRDKLQRVSMTIDEWLKVQKQWKLLYNIFLKSEDIKSQLPESTKMFETVDRDFRDTMADAFANPLIVEATYTERYEQLLQMNLTIKQCEKALNEYLEQKKKAFPRFYFLSNSSLLTILSNGTNPPKVCEFLGDCFDGLKTFKFAPPKIKDDIPKEAISMTSKDGENIEFSTPLKCEGPVESWLNDAEQKMRATLEEITQSAKNTSELWDQGEKPREEWVSDYCAQIALLTTQMVWTEDVLRAFEDLSGGSEQSMKDCYNLIVARIKGLITRIQGDLTFLERNKIINIITIDVHSRDVVQKFDALKIQEPEQFAFQSQLKFYWESKDSTQDMAQRQNLRFWWEKDRERCKCIIKIVDWYRFYSYEYVGNTLRLVVTPLTDRCYITLTQALNLTMGGAPAGPAGTGKTETTKDLGRGVGLLVMVFNCSDQMNNATMAQVFMGLAQQGCWGCFDEFNRISIEVLSVVSSQVKSILDKLKEKQQKFIFMEEGEINLVDTVGMFITMNPGYAGRTELPENLKALFRSCAMVVPDIMLICENMLMSEGFIEAKPLSKKFVTLYDLSKELLSKQRHYDWGLRAVKSVLRQAGGLLRSSKTELKAEGKDIEKEFKENPLLMRALREFNLPKIVTDDKPIFLRLIDDLFPGVDYVQKQDEDMKKLVAKTSKKYLGLQPEDMFILKVIQMSEILWVRHCMFVLGPPGSGKTTVWRTLAKTLSERGELCEYDTLNPKAVTSDELFGSYTKTKEWKNGVLSIFMRNQSRNEDRFKPHHKHKWTILDGDVDPEWIESLNTVMDDNKVLTLVSSDRIPLTNEMRLIFEVANLKNATPATVSRGGVLFINDTDIGWMPYFNSWVDRSKEQALKNLNKETQDDYNDMNAPPQIDDIAKSVFYRCFQSLQAFFEANNDIKYIAPKVDIMLIQTLCSILDALLQEHAKNIKKMPTDDDQKAGYETLFAFAGMWALGGALEEENDQKNFTSIWKASQRIKFPEQGVVFDYYFDSEKNTWINWTQKVTEYQPQEIFNFSKIYVPTLHTTRLRELLNIHVKRLKPVMFIGPAGTGKTAVMKDFLSQQNPEKTSYRTTNFSSFTDSLALQVNIESMVEKKSGRIYGSAQQKLLVYFIDDMNMPFVDKYGTQSPIALLRQILDYQLIFNREMLEEKKNLEDLLFMGSLNPKSGSFVIDLRLQRHFSLFTMYTPAENSIKTVYGQLVQHHFLSFDVSLQKVAEKIVEGTVYVYNKVANDPRFSPTARRFHYQFNLRELSNVTQGLLLSQSHHYNKAGPVQLVKLWVHECKRVFEDRMINSDDIANFRVVLKEGLVRNFGEEYTEQALNSFYVFTQYVAEHQSSEKSYLPTDNLELLKTILEEKLNDYNDVKANMDLVLFEQAIEHVSRIVRILDFPIGNALLVGVGGSGKQSLSRLAAFILGYDVDQVVVTASFGINDLKAFFQEVYKKAAKPSAVPRVFMITDSQIKTEKFLIPINDMLSLGWISDLFPKEDVDGMVQGLRNEAKAELNLSNPTPEQCYDYFLDKVKKNLKIILCFSPVGENFRIKARKFPGLINNTQIDWFHSWPKQALISVAHRFIKNIEVPTEDLLVAMANNMAEVHCSIDEANKQYLLQERRYNYTTPKSFLELISFYKSIFDVKRKKIESEIARYEQGLLILEKTKSKVEGLQEDLQVKMVEVDKRRAETEILIEQVGAESEIANKEQQIANAEEQKTNAAAEIAGKIKQTADEALAEAIPAKERAKKAIACLDKSNITEMKSLGSPPSMVIVTGKLVMMMMGEKVNLNETDEKKIWDKIKVFMGNPSKMIDSILGYDAENIDDQILINVKKIIDQPDINSQFNEKNMQKKSLAASYMCAWILNILIYNTIYKKVKPLEEESQRASEELEQKKKELAIVQEKVRVLQEKVAELKRKLNEAETVKMKVEHEANMCKEKLTAAEKLVNGLADENKRWGENVIRLKENTLSIIGDCLLASAFVSYIGAFNSKFRKKLWEEFWMKDIVTRQIPFTDGVTPLKILTNEAQMATWKNQNLPSDMMSLQNATIITSCSRWPLIIDPQLQGSTWIRTANGEDLVVISITNPKYLNQLITAITTGKKVLIEGIQQEIDATLDPLLSRAIKKKGSMQLLEIGGQEIDYDPSFKLFLMTKMFNPHFRPELAAQCTIINFIVTEDGLEEQLLALVVKMEKNELEEKKQFLVKQQNEFKVELDRLEKQLLDSLNQADPDTILENIQLITIIDNTKTTAIQIEKQTQIAIETEQIINQQRELYRTVAAEGAMLYFILIQLNIVEHMYQYSLDAFSNFFRKAIEKVKEQDETRVDLLRSSIRYTIYQWVSRGLFEKHKLILLTLITFRLMQKKVIDVQYDIAQMDFLIKCIGKASDNPLDWLPNQAWDAVQGLIQLEEFKTFAQNMEKDAPNRFKDWYNDLNPEEQKLPLDWKKLENQPFQKLLVLRCLRPDRITVALTAFIKIALPNGAAFVEMDSKLGFTEILESSIEDSEPSTPIFFILSPGADPVQEVQKIAKKRKLEQGKTWHYLALGQGQSEIASRRISEGNKEGHWVMLQNIQLMPSWLNELEKILDSFSQDSGAGNANFRLFLSAEPSRDVPIGLLDRSIKLTNEPPAGLKANMKRAFMFFSKEEFEDKDNKVKSILFALCFFHSTMIERRRFGPKGWNMFYPFSIGDLRDSSLVLQKYMENSSGGKVPFEDLIYIFGEIMYGGHIVDDWDRRLCISYLFNIMNEQLFDELELFPYINEKESKLTFKCPQPTTYDKYIEHIETSLTMETPLAYGLHPNTEIGFRTAQCNTLFQVLLELQPKDTKASSDEGGGVKSANEIAEEFIAFVLEDNDMKAKIFNLEDTKTRIIDRGPFQNVFLQEIEYMNILVSEIIRSLDELKLGFAGQLTISEKMEDLITAISLNRVPVTWSLLAYPSKRGLGSWLKNLNDRHRQLAQFVEDPGQIPKVVMISRLFNPQSFLTAIKQDIGQKTQQELNKLYIHTEFTRKSIEEIDQVGKDGWYVFGFLLEGARWDIQMGALEESKPKEMFSVMPVCYCKALPVVETGREDKSLYACPCYKTEDRGNTYVFTGYLKTPAKYPPRKWILAGVAMILDVEGIGDEPKKAAAAAGGGAPQQQAQK